MNNILPALPAGSGDANVSRRRGNGILAAAAFVVSVSPLVSQEFLSPIPPIPPIVPTPKPTFGHIYSLLTTILNLIQELRPKGELRWKHDHHYRGLKRALLWPSFS